MTGHTLAAMAQRWLLDRDTYLWLGFSFSLTTVFIVLSTLWWQRQVRPDEPQPETPSNSNRQFFFFLAAMLALVVSRVWAIPHLYGAWFIQDDGFDACVMPFQMMHHETIWGNGTNYLTYLAYQWVYDIFDLNVRAAAAVNVMAFVLAFGLITYAVQRLVGTAAAMFVAVICAVSYPLVLHSVYATAITFAFLPLGVMLAVLAKPAGWASGVLLAFSLAVSLFLYPGGTLTGLCLLAAHMALMRRWWNWRALIGLAAGGAAAAGGVLLTRRLMAPAGHVTQWAGGFLRFDLVRPSTEVVIKDTFWKSETWNTYNAQAPYFEPMWFGWLVCGALFLLAALARRKVGKDDRWVAIALVVFFGSAVLSAMTGAYPGVRRIVCAIPFLYLVGGIVFGRLWNSRPRPWPVLALVVVTWGLMLSRTGSLIAREWPLSHESHFITEARKVLDRAPADTRKIVILCYPQDQFGGNQYRSALGTIKAYRHRFDPAVLLPRSIIDTGMMLSDMSGPCVVLCSDNVSERQLAKCMGRMPAETILLNHTYSPEPHRLAEAYIFVAAGAEPAPSAATELIDVSSWPMPNEIQCLGPVPGGEPPIRLKTQRLVIPATRGRLKTVEGGDLGPPVNVRARFSGRWQARGGEPVIFRLRADDGCCLYLDGRPILNYDGVHNLSGSACTPVQTLAPGAHKIEVEYFQWGGEAGLMVEWKPLAGGEFQTLSAGATLP